MKKETNMTEIAYTTTKVVTETVEVPVSAIYPDGGTFAEELLLKLLSKYKYNHDRLIEDLYSADENRVIHAAQILTRFWEDAELAAITARGFWDVDINSH
jgi:hypothetical protein